MFMPNDYEEPGNFADRRFCGMLLSSVFSHSVKFLVARGYIFCFSVLCAKLAWHLDYISLLIKVVLLTINQLLFIG